MTKAKTFDQLQRICWRCMKRSAGNSEVNLCLECRRTTQQMNKHYPYVLAVFDLTNKNILFWEQGNSPFK